VNALPARTSAMKAKRLPLADLECLELRLRRFSRSALASTTADWLRAGCLTGLRPCEWSDARLDGDMLVVANRKTSNSRGNGPVRTLDLSALSAADLKVVERMASTGAGWQAFGDFEIYQKRCAQVVYVTCKDIWPVKNPHYTLYSCRHQAVANSKVSMGRSEVSALVGHATERTAQRSYGRRSAAWDGNDKPGTAMPIAEQVATVKPWRNYWAPENVALRNLNPLTLTP
jgi:integrase